MPLPQWVKHYCWHCLPWGEPHGTYLPCPMALAPTSLSRMACRALRASRR